MVLQLFFRPDVLIPIGGFQLEIVEKVLHRFFLHFHGRSFIFCFLCVVVRHERHCGLISCQASAFLSGIIWDRHISVLIPIVQKLLRSTFGQLRFRSTFQLLLALVAVGVTDGRRQAAVAVARRELLEDLFA